MAPFGRQVKDRQSIVKLVHADLHGLIPRFSLSSRCTKRQNLVSPRKFAGYESGYYASSVSRGLIPRHKSLHRQRLFRRIQPRDRFDQVFFRAFAVGSADETCIADSLAVRSTADPTEENLLVFCNILFVERHLLEAPNFVSILDNY